MGNRNLDAIDHGTPFDWGKTSEDYAKYRDIYLAEFYEKILSLGLCRDGQRVLDIGTGTGVLPRNMYPFGAKWTGIDISESQIAQARLLAKRAGMEIAFSVCPAEEVSYPRNTFDVITACQCIWYPDHAITAPKFAGMLKKNGKFLILYMGWLPFEDEIAGKSEKLILKYHPNWTGAGDIVKPVWVPEEYLAYFDVTRREAFRTMVPFTRESWHGRMRACRGVGASMTPETLERWNREHLEMLHREAPEEFEVKHYIAFAELSLRR